MKNNTSDKYFLCETKQLVHEVFAIDKGSKDNDNPKGRNKDGFRILVDRLWPRGLSKDKVKVDLWQKDIAPSNSLRKWFEHDEKEVE